VLTKLIDTDENGIVSETEINTAIAILEKAKQNKRKTEQRHSFLLFNNYHIDNNTNLQ
jgi:hypothetical protein